MQRKQNLLEKLVLCQIFVLNKTIFIHIWAAVWTLKTDGYGGERETSLHAKTQLKQMFPENWLEGGEEREEKKGLPQMIYAEERRNIKAAYWYWYGSLRSSSTHTQYE